MNLFRPKYGVFLRAHKKPMLVFDRGTDSSMIQRSHSLNWAHADLGCIVTSLYQMESTQKVVFLSLVENLPCPPCDLFLIQTLTLLYHLVFMRVWSALIFMDVTLDLLALLGWNIHVIKPEINLTFACELIDFAAQSWGFLHGISSQHRKEATLLYSNSIFTIIQQFITLQVGTEIKVYKTIPD